MVQIKYCCTYWGSENIAADVFVDKVLAAGYEGIEIFLPSTSDAFSELFFEALEDVLVSQPHFLFIAQQLTAPDNETVEQYIARMQKSLLTLSAYQPSFINSHTGKDYFSFDDNCKVLEAALNISSKTGVRILHETHRGRFSFHAASLIPYLKKFPELELVADFSHFCAVSESLLQDQEAIVEQIIPHVSHIHARVGHEQGAQVNHPSAPEWERHVAAHEAWWQQIIAFNRQQGKPLFSITPEFGPAPYMPSLPYTQQPLANQWDINHSMMQRLKTIL
jgi:sugar phosphate isomerase/epimerase